MKKIPLFSLAKFIVLASISTLLFSCGSKQDIVYFQNVDNLGISKSINKYTPTISPDDMLTITVSALDQDGAKPFNLPTINFSINGIVGQEKQQTYLVDANGNIDFPVLGNLKLAGLSRIQATNLIKDLLKDYIKNPIVNIRTINFKITILGEVNRPGTYTIDNERITILEAFGLAGDLAIKGERKNVLVIREINGKKTTTRIDLTTQELFNSPVYYLVQNDVIYVEPNNSRAKGSSIGLETTTSLRVLQTMVTVAALIISINR